MAVQAPSSTVRAGREVAIVSGGGSGIGKAISLGLARRGAVVAVTDRNGSAAAATAAEIRQGGGVAEALTVDVAEEEQLARAVDTFVAGHSRLCTVVAAAGITRAGFVHKMSSKDWNDVIAVNLTGTFNLAKACVPWMLQSGGGSFVAISSYAGRRGAVGHAAYCASKHGVIGLVRAMALDYGDQNIRSNAVCPGFVETPMAEEIFSNAPIGTREEIEASVPMGRFARAEEIASVVAHLTTAEASYANGMVYAVDGGASSGTLFGKPIRTNTRQLNSDGLA